MEAQKGKKLIYPFLKLTFITKIHYIHYTRYLLMRLINKLNKFSFWKYLLRSFGMYPATKTIFKSYVDNDDNIIIYKASTNNKNNTTSSIKDNIDIGIDIDISPFYTLKNTHQNPIKFVSIIDENTFDNRLTLLSAGLDKTIKYWEILENEHKCLSEIKHMKKIDHGYWDSKERKLIFSDKTGEIHHTTLHHPTLTKPERIQANMATLTTLDIFDIDPSSSLSTTLNTQKLVFMTDEYSRLKIFKYPAISHLIAFLSPYQHYFKQVLNLSPHCFVLLFADGNVELLDNECILPSIYQATRFLVKDKLKGKKAYELCKISHDEFAIIDEYYTMIYTCKIEGHKIIQESHIDLTTEKLIDNSTKYFSNRELSLIQFNENEKYLTMIVPSNGKAVEHGDPQDHAQAQTQGHTQTHPHSEGEAQANQPDENHHKEKTSNEDNNLSSSSHIHPHESSKQSHKRVLLSDSTQMVIVKLANL